MGKICTCNKREKKRDNDQPKVKADILLLQEFEKIGNLNLSHTGLTNKEVNYSLKVGLQSYPSNKVLP